MSARWLPETSRSYGSIFGRILAQGLADLFDRGEARFYEEVPQAVGDDRVTFAMQGSLSGRDVTIEVRPRNFAPTVTMEVGLEQALATDDPEGAICLAFSYCYKAAVERYEMMEGVATWVETTIEA
jgi:hypothetical protein